MRYAIVLLQTENGTMAIVFRGDNWISIQADNRQQWQARQCIQLHNVTANDIHVTSNDITIHAD
jgi:hypothetical protein